MEITRHNYEEYFLLYVDNELNAMERKAVEVFVQENTDLEEELVMLQQSVVRPDDKLVFVPKEYLLKDTSKQGLVNEGNYEEYFVLYGDDELTNQQKDLVEQFVYKFPQYQAEFELIQQARLIPEPLNFPDKQNLYRSEKDDNRVVPFAWWRMVAAAVILLAGGLYLLNNESRTVTPPIVKTIPTQEIVKEEKKPDAPSNIIETPRVQQVTYKPKENKVVKTTEETEYVVASLSVKPVEVAVENSKPVDISETTISAPAAINTLAVATPNEIQAPTTSFAASEEVIETQPSTHYILNAPINKTPLRGLFRKISRVVDKATTVERDENGKGGVRIANFEIGLK